MTKNPERKPKLWRMLRRYLVRYFLYDFQICGEYEELAQTLNIINRNGYDLITVTQDSRGFFTVFFRRRACG